MSQPAFTITVYDSAVGADVLSQTAALYREVYTEAPYFERDEDFADFASVLPRRAEQENFRLVVARLGFEPLGFGLGHRLPAATRWWEGALAPLPADITTGHAGRTFALIELAVLKQSRRRGLGRRLHAHLTVDLDEERTTLLVRPEAEAAWSAYSKWGYRKVGQVQPSANAPIYDAMLKTNSSQKMQNTVCDGSKGVQ